MYSDRDTFYTPTRRGPGLGFIIFSAIVVSALVWLSFGRSAPRSVAPVNVDPRPVTARGDLAADERATIELFETTSPSVAYISPTRKLRQSPFSRNPEEVVVGTGSGVVWDKHGHVVTNFHVTEGGSGWLIKLHDGKEYQAELVGASPDKDLAVLKINVPEESLVPVNVGTSQDLRVGQKVFAIGNPFGLDYSLSTGVVSALNRDIPSQATGRIIHGVIQTDAAINPGNSGGPLLDSAGRLIGINTAIYSTSGGSAGIGFAVPVDVVNDIVPQLIAHGRVIRPGLGVSIVPDQIARQLGIDGVLISEVQNGSGAEDAGLRGTTQRADGRILIGDAIIKINDEPISNGSKLLDVLEGFEAGQSVQVTVLRDGEPLTVSVTLQPLR